METILSRAKAVIQNDSTLSVYIKGVAICSPATIPDLTNSLVPWIGLAPLSSPEAWRSNKKKTVTHVIEVYVVNFLRVEESSLIGVGGLKGLLDIVNDVSSALRGNTFTDYLSRPADIIGVVYNTSPYGEGIYLIVATISLQCERIFDVS